MWELPVFVLREAQSKNLGTILSLTAPLGVNHRVENVSDVNYKVSTAEVLLRELTRSFFLKNEAGDMTILPNPSWWANA